MTPDKIYINKYMIRPGMLYKAQEPADTPEYEYIRKDALLEMIKERLKLYDPDNPEEETVCYELQSIIRYLNEDELIKQLREGRK